MNLRKKRKQLPDASSAATSTTAPNLRKSKSRRASWHAESSDDAKLKKNRKIVGQHLRRMGKKVGRDMELNSVGMCYFPFNKFVIVVEVPDDNRDICFLYTMVSRLGTGDNKEEAMRVAMTLNYMQIGSKGATLGMEGDEINLCFTVPITSLASSDLTHYLMDFMHAAQDINKQLDSAKLIPKHVG